MRRFASLTLAAVVLLAPAVQAQTLDRIKETGAFKLGYRQDAPPFAYDNTLGEPAGFSVELCRQVAADAKNALGLDQIQIEYVPVDTGDRFQAIQDGTIDILCGATTVTLSRRELVDFSLFTFLDGASVLLRQDGPEEFEGLAGQKIGVRGATTTEEALRNTLQNMQMDAEVVTVGSHDEGVQQLLAGDIAAYFGDQAILIFLATGSEAPDQLKLSDSQFTHEPYALGLARGDDEFRLQVDRTLSRIYRSGAIDQIFTNNFGKNAKATGALKAVYLINGLSE